MSPRRIARMMARRKHQRAAAITDATAKKAVASLAAKVNALEAIIDGFGTAK